MCRWGTGRSQAQKCPPGRPAGGRRSSPRRARSSPAGSECRLHYRGPSAHWAPRSRARKSGRWRTRPRQSRSTTCPLDTGDTKRRPPMASRTRARRSNKSRSPQQRCRAGQQRQRHTGCRCSCRRRERRRTCRLRRWCTTSPQHSPRPWAQRNRPGRARPGCTRRRSVRAPTCRLDTAGTPRPHLSWRPPASTIPKGRRSAACTTQGRLMR